MADRKLFIGNLVRRITQDDLWVMYSTYGPLEECAKFHESFGFVRFLHAEDARQALKATHGITLKGRCIKVEFAATTTSWRSATNSSCNDCRSTVRYNIPPIRAVDFTTTRDHHHAIVSPSPSYSPSSAIDPIGHRRKPKSKSATSESTVSTVNSIDIRQSQLSCSSSPSSYAASPSHIAEIDDHDCDLDSGFNDELDCSLLLTSLCQIPTSPWYDVPVADGMFIWDFQLYADIARDRDFPVMKIDHSSSEWPVDDDDNLWKKLGHCVPMNVKEYL